MWGSSDQLSVLTMVKNIDPALMRKVTLAFTILLVGLLAAGTSTSYLLVCVNDAEDVPCPSS